MIILRKGYFMPKMVLCFEVGKDPEFEQGKFWEERSIPKGWIIDRDIHKPIVNTEAIKKEMTTDELKEIGITVLPPTTIGLDITGQPDSFKEGDTIGESTALPLKKKSGPKLKSTPLK